MKWIKRFRNICWLISLYAVIAYVASFKIASSLQIDDEGEGAAFIYIGCFYVAVIELLLASVVEHFYNKIAIFVRREEFRPNFQMEALV